MQGLSPAMQAHLQRYIGKTGYLKVTIPGRTEEAPIWCPCRVLDAHHAYQKIFLLVEPIGGYGTMRIGAVRFWMDDPKLNKCKGKPL